MQLYKTLIISLTFTILLSQITLSNQSANCNELVQNGTCDFYEKCIESKSFCGPTGYAMGYGTRYCKKFTKYIFYDDDKNVVIKIDIPEAILNLINIECININFQERALDMKVDVPNGDPYFLTFKKLFQKIVPEECKYKIFKGKISITLRKKNEDEEWEKLNA